MNIIASRLFAWCVILVITYFLTYIFWGWANVLIGIGPQNAFCLYSVKILRGTISANTASVQFWILPSNKMRQWLSWFVNDQQEWFPWEGFFSQIMIVILVIHAKSMWKDSKNLFLPRYWNHTLLSYCSQILKSLFRLYKKDSVLWNMLLPISYAPCLDFHASLQPPVTGLSPDISHFNAQVYK